jgi:hypothetical protein
LVSATKFGLTNVLLFVLPGFFALPFFDVSVSEGRELLGRLSAALLSALEGQPVECESWDVLRIADPAQVAAFRVRLSRALGAKEARALQSLAEALPRLTEFGECGVPVTADRTRPVIRRFAEPAVVGGRPLTAALLSEVRKAQMDRDGTARLR